MKSSNIIELTGLYIHTLGNKRLQDHLIHQNIKYYWAK